MVPFDVEDNGVSYTEVQDWPVSNPCLETTFASEHLFITPQISEASPGSITWIPRESLHIKSRHKNRSVISGWRPASDRGTLNWWNFAGDQRHADLILTTR